MEKIKNKVALKRVINDLEYTVVDLKDFSDKLHILSGKILSDYSYRNPSDEKVKMEILYNHNENSVYIDMVSDYIIQVKEKVKKLEGEFNSLFDLVIRGDNPDETT